MLHVIGDFERLSDHAVNIAETAREMHDKEITFSAAAWRELDVLTGAINEILDLAIKSYIARDVAMAAQVEPLEEVIDDLTREIRTRHIQRLRSGECTIELRLHTDRPAGQLRARVRPLLQHRRSADRADQGQL